MEQKLNQLTLTQCPPSEPIEEVLDKHTDTLCNAQKKTSFESSLLQDIVATLISEALTSQKTWGEIKDCLHLKISNTDIDTSISCFMDIQQSHKESLAAYVHQFK